jgi:hypothetical protein
MLKFKEATVTIRRSPVKDYCTVDIRIRTDGGEKEVNELIPDSDFESRFDKILILLKQEVLNLVKDIEDNT